LPRQQYLLVALAPTRSQERLALVVAGALVAALLVSLPFADQPGPRQTAFIPIVDTILCLNDLVTAALLFAIWSVVGGVAIMALATGYLFTSFIIVPHLLTFPGVFAPTGLLGAGLNTTVWLYIFWHLGLPPAAIVYAICKRESAEGRVDSSADPRAIWLCVGAVLAVVIALTSLVTAGERWVPAIMADSLNASARWRHLLAPLLVVLNVAALVILWRRRTSVLDLWLLVVLWAWLIETLLLAMTDQRYSVVWYMGRACGLLTSAFVLLALLFETTLLYARFSLSLAAQEQERERRRGSLEVLVGSLAHELRQPLCAIMANGEAGEKLLAQPAPDVAQAAAAFKDVVLDGQRATQIIESTRSMYSGTLGRAERVDISRLVDEVLVLLRGEIQSQGIAVDWEPRSQPLTVHGNKGQLLQALLNLVTNAVEAMMAVPARERTLQISAGTDGQTIVVAVSDSGAGIDPAKISSIFDPFYSTKVRGIGLGLAICRAIVDSHGGRLSVRHGSLGGAEFIIVLKAPGTDPAPA
jgi:signal transduction histidine kinase